MLGKLHIIFFAVSVFIGLLTVAVNPPLRGPDETAHFLRAFGISQGDVVPRTVDARGRRGLFLPADLHDQLSYFNAIRETLPGPDNRYGDIFRRYFDQDRTVTAHETAPVFVVYEGSEGYSPIAYMPYVAAALIGKAGRLNFLGLLYLMRTAGLLAATLIAAYAIAITPWLKWMFFCTAMLPTALYERAVISVDGAVLSSTLLVTALCLRCIGDPNAGMWQRAIWMTVCSLTKPPQLAFILLEAMHSSCKDWRIQWRTVMLIALPGLILSFLWVIAVSADVGAWRVSEGSGLPPEEFDPAWKFVFLLQHPYRFISAAVTSLDYAPELWRQMIGVFGWLDVPMRSLAYPVISVLLAMTLFARLGFDTATRIRIAIVSASVIMTYCLAVFAIFFVTMTPSSAERIYGLQGRYFIVILPPLALIVSAIFNRGLGYTGALAAVTSSLVSAAVMLEALWRVHWWH
jgi:uncharacterized membrane protein